VPLRALKEAYAFDPAIYIQEAEAKKLQTSISFLPFKKLGFNIIYNWNAIQ
jgi:hypothetical protein